MSVSAADVYLRLHGRALDVTLSLTAIERQWQPACCGGLWRRLHGIGCMARRMKKHCCSARREAVAAC